MRRKIVVAAVLLVALMALLHLVHTHRMRAVHEGHGDAPQPSTQASLDAR